MHLHSAPKLAYTIFGAILFVFFFTIGVIHYYEKDIWIQNFTVLVFCNIMLLQLFVVNISLFLPYILHFVLELTR